MVDPTSEPNPHLAPRRPGRPRSERSHQAILAATAELVAELGYSLATVGEIAGRAGVGKQTIYRRWPTKADLVLEATANRAGFAVPIEDHHSYAADLRAFLSASHAMADRPETADLLRALMIEAQLQPSFGERFRASFLAPRRAAFAEITARAAARGDLPPSPSPDTVAEIVFGTLWYRLLALHEPFDEALREDLVAVLAGG